MYVGLYAICVCNWNWKLTQDHFLIKHWSQHTHRCSAPVVALEEYSAHDWRAATSVQRAPGTCRAYGLAACAPPLFLSSTLQWRHDGRDSVSNHQPHDCFLNRLFRRRSKKTSKLRVTGLCAGNSPGTGELPAQMASNAENVSIWWRHHGSLGTLNIETLVNPSIWFPIKILYLYYGNPYA